MLQATALLSAALDKFNALKWMTAGRNSPDGLTVGFRSSSVHPANSSSWRTTGPMALGQAVCASGPLQKEPHIAEDRSRPQLCYRPFATGGSLRSQPGSLSLREDGKAAKLCLGFRVLGHSAGSCLSSKSCPGTAEDSWAASSRLVRATQS